MQRLYALSAAHNTLLVVDPAEHTIVAAYGLAGIEGPVGLAFKGAMLHVIDGSGRVWTAEIRGSPADRLPPGS